MEYLRGYILISHPQQIVKALGVAQGNSWVQHARKKKFGLNCQGGHDAVQQARILDISIQYPGSISDCLQQLVEQGILDLR
jgi:hypothetical protein